MIIQDTEFHKIDVVVNKDSFLQFTTFHKKGSEWNVKVTAISPETCIRLHSFLTENYIEPNTGLKPEKLLMKKINT